MYFTARVMRTYNISTGSLGRASLFDFGPFFWLKKGPIVRFSGVNVRIMMGLTSNSPELFSRMFYMRKWQSVVFQWRLLVLGGKFPGIGQIWANLGPTPNRGPGHDLLLGQSTPKFVRAFPHKLVSKVEGNWIITFQWEGSRKFLLEKKGEKTTKNAPAKGWPSSVKSLWHQKYRLNRLQISSTCFLTCLLGNKRSWKSQPWLHRILRALEVGRTPESKNVPFFTPGTEF